MKTNHNVAFYWLLAFALFTIAFMNAAYGDKYGDDVDIDIRSSDDMNTITSGDVNVAGGDTNVSTGGNKTFAFSHGLGDVDINEGSNCYGSEAWGSFIVSRQYLELNTWCASLFFELNGRHLFAAKMRCDIPEISDKYATEEACWSDQRLGPDTPSSDVNAALIALQLQVDALATALTQARESGQEQLQEQRELIEEVHSTPPPVYRVPAQKQQEGLREGQRRDLEALFAEMEKGEDEDG